MKNARLLLSLMLFMLCGAGYAEVGAYDAFAYKTGEILGESQNTFGFTGEWGYGGGIASQSTVLEESLVFPGTNTAVQQESGMLQVLVPNFDGSRVGRFLDLDPNSVFGDYINEDGTIGKSGNTIYMSFLMKSSYATPFYAFELKRGDLGDGGAILYVGNDMGDTVQVCAFRDRNTAESNIGVHLNFLGAPTTDTELFVVRIDYGDEADNVTVYRNPSLSSEPEKTPDLVNAGDLTFDAMTFAAWVGPGGRTAQFDEVCIGTTYNDVVRFYEKPERAQSPSPADGGVDIDSDQSVTLSWIAGTGAPVTGYEVYFSKDIDAVIASSPYALQGSTAANSITIADIDSDSTYYWSVTETRNDPNYIPGAVWKFETNKTYPNVVSQPVSQRVFAGENVDFTFSVTSETNVAFQWFDQDGIITDGDNVSGTDTDTLVITSAVVANENSYYCEATNSAGTITSNTVSLLLNRLVGYWDLDKPADIANIGLDNSASANNLKVAYNDPGAYSWVEGADGKAEGALVFDGGFALATQKEDGTMNDIPVKNEPYTMSVWFKTTPKTEGFIGWGNYGSYNQCNGLAIYEGDPTRVNNYWWDNDLNVSRGYILADNSWHTVAVTYDGTTRIIYIDGIEAGRNNPAAHNVPSSINFLLGRTNTAYENAEFLVGALDEAKVFNYALTANQIADIYVTVTGEELCLGYPSHDYNGDCKVNLIDLTYLMRQWLNCGIYPDCVDGN